MRLRRRIPTLEIVLFLAGVAACSGEDSPTGANGPTPGLPADITAADVQEGRTIFHSFGNCFQCHGQDGGGTTSAPNLTQGPWLHIDGSFAAIVQLVTTGVPQPKQFPAFMPPKGGGNLTADQVRWVAAYVFTISRAKPPPERP